MWRAAKGNGGEDCRDPEKERDDLKKMDASYQKKLDEMNKMIKDLQAKIRK